MPFYRDATKKMRYFLSFLRKDMVHLNIQLLYKCNFKCAICDFWKEPYADYRMLNVDDVQLIAEKIQHFGPLVVSIGGGEPLLHDNLPEIVSILTANNFPVMICNGWFMTPAKAKELWEAGMYEISISVDYIDPAQHDRQRGVAGAFARATEALHMLHEQRTSPHQRVHMISVIMNDNLEDIEPLINLARKIGVTYLVTLYSNGRGKKNSMVPDKEISRHLLKLREKYPEFVSIPGYIERFSEATAKNGIKPCYAGKNLFNIDSQGNVSRCIDCLDDSAGNILTDDIAAIQQNLLQLPERAECRGCWTSCRGSFEPLLYGKQRLKNIVSCYQTVKDVPLAGPKLP